MLRKQQIIEVSLFLALGITIVWLSCCCYNVYKGVRNERLARAKEVELQTLSFRMANASDYLTSEVRKFAVTLNPVHLRNYWTEINDTQTREKVISRLKDLEIPEDEFKLLTTAKNNSDNLVNIETRAMKLILRVYEVPEEQMEKSVRKYQLTKEDEDLSNNSKVNRAREILYNTVYEQEKKKILGPIAQYEKKMSERVHLETMIAAGSSDSSLLWLIIAIACVIAYLILLTHFMLVKIFFPLKMYVLHEDEQEKNAEELLLNSKLSAILKSTIILMKKRLQAKRPH